MKKTLFFSLTVCIAASLLILASCEIKPSGSVINQERTINSSFQDLSVENGFNLILTQSDDVSLSIETNENLHKYIVSEVKNNTLKIYIENNVSFSNAVVKIYVSCNLLKNLNLSGGSVVDSLEWKGENLVCNFSGGSRLQGSLDIKEKLDFNLSGGSKIELSGEAKSLEINSAGGGNQHLCNFNTNDAEVNISGGGKLTGKLNVLEDIEVNLSGGSKIELSGEANSLEINSAGGGNQHLYNFNTNDAEVNISGGGKSEVNVNTALYVAATGGSKIYYKGKGDLKKSELSGGSTIEKVD